MTEQEADKLGFREWTAHYEKEQKADREKINDVAAMVGVLSGSVSKLSANMETLIDNQKGLFSRVNRPWQWGVVVAGFMTIFSMAGMFGVMSTLIVGPIQANIRHLEDSKVNDTQRNLELHMWFRETIAGLEVENGYERANIEWLMMLEKRQNNRLHSRYGISSE